MPPPPTPPASQVPLSSGSSAAQLRKEARVVLTGFGPFGTVVHNPSFLTVSALPESIELDPVLAEDSNSVVAPLPSRIRLLAHPTAIPVTYEDVFNLVPQLYTQYTTENSNVDVEASTPDFFIHVGAGRPGQYNPETTAHRDGYGAPDVNGKFCFPVPPLVEDPEQQTRGFPIRDGDGDATTPTVLSNGIDLAAMTKRAKARVPSGAQLILSHDAGYFLCDFIYYNSLYQAQKRLGPEGLNRVMFFHIPPECDIAEAVEVLKVVIQELVRQRWSHATRTSTG